MKLESPKPVEAVKGMMQAIAEERYDEVGNFVCSENSSFINSMDLGSQLAKAFQINRQYILDAIDIKMSNMSYELIEQDDTSASVGVRGRFDVSVNAEKMKTVLVMSAKAQGNSNLDQAKVDAVTADFVRDLPKFGRDFDETAHLVLRDGHWVICE